MPERLSLRDDIFLPEVKPPSEPSLSLYGSVAGGKTCLLAKDVFLFLVPERASCSSRHYMCICYVCVICVHCIMMYL